ncbi:MAG: hypothetical protein KAS32_10865 [Candidatus Peribacteraceae bacterium]|nr:hypothetical protein [Candidatus Peribacteraceae bacterium]
MKLKYYFSITPLNASDNAWLLFPNIVLFIENRHTHGGIGIAWLKRIAGLYWEKK